MRKILPRLGLVLAFSALARAADPAEVTVEVAAGVYDRRDTPISIVLPEAFGQATTVTLERLGDHATLPVQLVDGDGDHARAVWVLEKPLTAGTSRRYTIKSVSRPSTAPDTKESWGRSGVVVRDGAVILHVEGRPVLTYHAEVVEPPKGVDRVYRRSGFIHPLTTPSGLCVTDAFPADHVHQHGLFFAWVNTTFEGRHVDFWNQKEHTGWVENVGSVSQVRGAVEESFRATLRHDDLTAPGGPAPVLNEVWRVKVYNVKGPVVVDFESEQACAGTRPLTVNKYHYGGLGIRGNTAWFDPKVNGDDPPDPARSGHSDFLTSEGKHRADGNHTRPRWVDLSGEVDGKAGGLTVLSHPSNFRFPQPVRLHPNKPYFCFSPMVLGAFTIEPGKPYVSRYRLLVHDGAPDLAAIERAWDDYADPPVVRVVGK